MAYKASHKFCRIAPRKARLVADLIRGRGVADALTELEFSKRRGAYFVQGVLKSAIANAEQASADVSRLVVVESRVDEGPTIKRFQQKDRGRAHPIMKRTSHIIVAVDIK
ncbi:MAG: ribosomal protein [Planctomycetota bacterium]|jgi:large subunit ribosomal protein L22|nr:50S ribosomal protein L22 [Phycisphaerae bacterium]MBU6208713.1 50S ribosomal protein L22 [Planctomycetota bacterium]MDI9411268.1 50S ribosomal protein L22 [Bacteroidia bacterium]RLS50538.1 MAG: 50S ribosomal protein L22 [Planctomycetota bacterium]RLS53050.1 MAG: 50S ribosomal protein L22 [Planctomycetota bacterium]